MSGFLTRLPRSTGSVATCATGGALTLMGIALFLKGNSKCQDSMNCGFNDKLCAACKEKKENKKKQILRSGGAGALFFGGLAIIIVGGVSLIRRR